MELNWHQKISLQRQSVDFVGQHHEVHQTIGTLHMPLAVRLLRVAPRVTGVDTISGLESRGQHREAVEVVSGDVLALPALSESLVVLCQVLVAHLKHFVCHSADLFHRHLTILDDDAG